MGGAAPPIELDDILPPEAPSATTAAAVAPSKENATPVATDANVATGAAAAPRRDAAGVDQPALRFCERFLELLIDLLSQLPTRRFLHTLLDERQVRRAPEQRAPAWSLSLHFCFSWLAHVVWHACVRMQ